MRYKGWKCGCEWKTIKGTLIEEQYILSKDKLQTKEHCRHTQKTIQGQYHSHHVIPTAGMLGSSASK